MPQETLGYVKLEWTCPKCATRNPGTEKMCVSCGAPQPEDLKFEQAQGQQLSQDEALKKIAEAGPDIHCAFCGARNPATATVCAQCGADLKEGKRRQAGQVVGAYQAGPLRQIACANCGTLNPETAIKCAGCGAPLGARPAAAPAAAPQAVKSPVPVWVWIAISAVAVICLVGGLGWLVNRSMTRSNLVGQVAAANWQTSVDIEALGPVNHRGWQDEIPSGAQVGSCENKVYTTQDQEPSGGDYNKVCGTPYTVDTGSGVGKVVQDCQYEVLAPYCEYSVQEWRIVGQAEESGQDGNPFFAQPRLEQGQRLGSQHSSYLVVFETLDGARIDYSVPNEEELRRFQVGSRWTLTLNGFGQIVSVEPVQ